MIKEERWDKLLKIKTCGRDDSHSDSYHYPYEPTPYSVLARLANYGYITKKNTLLDFGCGKGRVSFFLAYQARCRSIGIEYDERLCLAALKNQEKAVSGSRVKIQKTNAETFMIPDEVDRLYFFNPFSTEILMKVFHRIRETLYEHPRELLLFFYYPSDEYIAYLMTVDELAFMDEIDCRDLFDGDDRRERILIFKCGFL